MKRITVFVMEENFLETVLFQYEFICNTIRFNSDERFVRKLLMRTCDDFRDLRKMALAEGLPDFDSPARYVDLCESIFETHPNMEEVRPYGLFFAERYRDLAKHIKMHSEEEVLA